MPEFNVYYYCSTCALLDLVERETEFKIKDN